MSIVLTLDSGSAVCKYISFFFTFLLGQEYGIPYRILTNVFCVLPVPSLILHEGIIDVVVT